MRETTRSDFGARLYAARKHAGMSQTEVAKAVQISQGTYAQAEKSGQSSGQVTRLAAVLGVNADWLATGEGNMLDRPHPEEVDLDAHPDLTPIRKVTLRLQAGVSGFAVDPLDEIDGPPIFFRNDWLQQRGYKPYNLITVKVKGQSMESNLHDGDLVVINTADTEPKDGEVFAANYEGEAVIKRVKRERGTWWLTSDNLDKARYPDKECVEGTCIIIGRIIHKQSEKI